MVKEYNKVATKPAVIKNKEDETIDVVEQVTMTKLVKGKPKKVKKGLMERMVIGLIGPDGLPRVADHVRKEIIGPTMKNMIYESLSNGLRMLVFRNEPTNYRGGPTNYGGGYTNYNSRYGGARSTGYATHTGTSSSVRKDPTPAVDPRNPDQVQKLYNGTILQGWALESHNDAVLALQALKDNAYEYGKVSVANYYEVLGLPTSYTDFNFGWNWDDVEHVDIRMSHGEYFLQLPPVRIIK